jgi:cytochrome b6-f complex iron-sulfur subunit
MRSRIEAAKRKVIRNRADGRISRRTLIATGSGGLVAGLVGLVGGLGRFLVPNVIYEKPRRFAVGRPDDFPPSSATFLSEHRIFVFNTPRGFYAVSAVCTHLGCNIMFVDARGFECPCHGSVFDMAGFVVDGPATRPLPHYPLVLSKRGELIVDTQRTVDADHRFQA